MMFHLGPFYEAEKDIKAAACRTSHLAVHQGHTASNIYGKKKMQNSYCPSTLAVKRINCCLFVFLFFLKDLAHECNSK